MADKNKKIGIPGQSPHISSIIKNQRSPLMGISTDEHDMSTGHGGSKFEVSLMENNLNGGGSRVVENSILDHGS